MSSPLSKLSKSKILLLWKHWDTVEKKIKEEMIWLERNIDTFLDKEITAPKGCRECFLRRIAILVVSGKVKATEITKSPLLKSFWINKKVKKNNEPKKRHGSDWHQKTMKRIENHFLCLRYEIIREPDLNQGRADLGVYKKGKQDLLIEVGTISLFKFWRNLETMKRFTYLIVPDDNKLIEFRKN